MNANLVETLDQLDQTKGTLNALCARALQAATTSLANEPLHFL